MRGGLDVGGDVLFLCGAELKSPSLACSSQDVYNYEKDILKLALEQAAPLHLEESKFANTLREAKELQRKMTRVCAQQLWARRFSSGWSTRRLNRSWKWAWRAWTKHRSRKVSPWLRKSATRRWKLPPLVYCITRSRYLDLDTMRSALTVATSFRPFVKLLRMPSQRVT